MKKMLCLMIIIWMLAGCGPAASLENAEPGETVTFQDDLGRTVTVQRPQRVAALIGSFADIWSLAGGGDTLVAAAHDAWTNFDLNLDGEVTDLGTVAEPSLEALIAAEPDLVLASCNTDADLAMLDMLEEMEIPAAYFSISSFPEYLNMLEICTTLTGQTQRFETYGTAVQQQVDAARAICDGSQPRVLYIRASASGCKVKNSQDSVLGEMLKDLDCQNIADSDTSLLEELSLEAILDADPDFIFAVLQGADPTVSQETLEKTLLENPAWQSLTAVREGRYYMLDKTLYNLKPNAKWGDAYENLANILYERP